MQADRARETVFQTSAGPIAMRMTSDLQSVSAVWRRFQDSVVCTCAQTFDWASAFSTHVLKPEGNDPVIAVGYGADETIEFLLAFETRTVGGLKVLRWLGQDYANYLFGLFRPGFAARLSKTDMSRILNEVGQWCDASVAALESQPFSWEGTDNPFALLSHQTAPNSGYAVQLGDFETLYNTRFKARVRRGFNRKERRLRDAGKLDYGWALSDEEKRHVLQTFFAQKEQQFAAMGVKDVFTPDARAFLGALAMLPDDSPSRLRLGYVALNGEILATFCGMVSHGRMNVLLSSLADSPLQRHSPGVQLLRHQVKEACDDGLAYYDLGSGAAQHKSEWYTTLYPLFDSYIALKPQGLVLALPYAAKSFLKRTIKTNARLWALAQKARKWVRG